MTNKFDRIHTNTNKKYVIRNCPAYRIEPDLCVERNLKNGEWISCQDCTDCTMKQIVELCGKYHVIDAGFQEVAINYLSNDILQLLQIEEVE